MASGGPIVGNGIIPFVLDHGGGRKFLGMRGRCVAGRGGLTVPGGLQERKRPQDQEWNEPHVQKHAFPFLPSVSGQRLTLAIMPVRSRGSNRISWEWENVVATTLSGNCTALRIVECNPPPAGGDLA